MSTTINVKVSGPWRTLIRQDNQAVRVVNANEEFVITLDDRSSVISFTPMTTDMPYSAPSAAVDETKAFAADPHEPDKTLEQREIAMDPEEKFREKREADAKARTAHADVGGSAGDKLKSDAQAIAQASGKSSKKT